MRRVRFARLAARDLIHELTYSQRTFGNRAEAALRERFRDLWRAIERDPTRVGRPTGPGQYRYGLRREKLVVLYRWRDGQDEDPVVMAVISGRRNLTTRSVTAYFRRKF